MIKLVNKIVQLEVLASSHLGRRNGKGEGLKMKITINSLSKVIKKNMVLNNINLTMESGKIYGFVGKNGSGKTMLFRAIAGLIKPTEGSVLIDEKEINNNLNIGIVIENIGLYPELTGFINLKLLASINKRVSDDKIRESIIRVGLDPEDKRVVKKYSLGMKQRIVLAQAIMEEPDILLLDEPTNALDESGINMIRKIIAEEADRGAIVALASHNREDIELLCTEKYYLSAGKLEGVIQ